MVVSERLYVLLLFIVFFARDLRALSVDHHEILSHGWEHVPFCNLV